MALSPDRCIDDLLQAVSRAAIGNGRLRPCLGPDYTLSHGTHALAFGAREPLPNSMEEIVECDIGKSVDIKETTLPKPK